MANFRHSSDQNTIEANKVLTNLGTTLRSEKEALSRVHTDLRTDNAKMNASIVSKIEQLHNDLPAKNAIMDKLAQKTKKANVLSVKLHYKTKRLDDLESDKTIF